MTARIRVSLANERADRPRWLGVGATALGGLVCGLLAMLALGRSLAGERAAEDGSSPAPKPPVSASEPIAAAGTAVDRGHRRGRAAARARVQPTAKVGQPATVEPSAMVGPPSLPLGGAPASELPPETAGAASTTTELPIDSQQAAAVEPLVAPAAAAQPPAPTVQHYELVRGHIAYLRCEGVPLVEGPFPCPRDRRLEKFVWAAVDRLPACALPAASGDDVELRVDFRTRGRHSFEVRPAGGSEPLARAVHACLAPDLELVRTSLRPLLMTVAFRFELR